mmetsp:Transcript_33820/g.55839  ORF Transcript_33820/g.55839 Transcript_33820/m.55839 type:complete len:91 (+) Transcript_33820:37-309(+)
MTTNVNSNSDNEQLIKGICIGLGVAQTGGASMMVQSPSVPANPQPISIYSTQTFQGQPRLTGVVPPGLGFNSTDAMQPYPPHANSMAIGS